MFATSLPVTLLLLDYLHMQGVHLALTGLRAEPSHTRTEEQREQIIKQSTQY